MLRFLKLTFYLIFFGVLFGAIKNIYNEQDNLKASLQRTSAEFITAMRQLALEYSGANRNNNADMEKYWIKFIE
ncbi:MAG: hypothetical protein IJS88_01475 [Alphaproteobacteria bacterium]|nr:hypothetical protein [Alphaproteobacteria bacterium]